MHQIRFQHRISAAANRVIRLNKLELPWVPIAVASYLLFVTLLAFGVTIDSLAESGPQFDLTYLVETQLAGLRWLCARMMMDIGGSMAVVYWRR